MARSDFELYKVGKNTRARNRATGEDVSYRQYLKEPPDPRRGQPWRRAESERIRQWAADFGHPFPDGRTAKRGYRIAKAYSWAHAHGLPDDTATIARLQRTNAFKRAVRLAVSADEVDRRAGLSIIYNSPDPHDWGKYESEPV